MKVTIKNAIYCLRRLADLSIACLSQLMFDGSGAGLK
jgi:hypothetical protein